MKDLRGSIVAIEGLWRVGKTTQINKLKKHIGNASFLSEPDHLQQRPRPGNVELWYLKQWTKRMRRARELKQKGRLVLMERSFVSTMAFLKTKKVPLSPTMKKLLKNLENNPPDLIVFLEVPHAYVKGLVTRKEDRKVLKTKVLVTNKFFVSRYNRQLLTIPPKLEIPYLKIPAGNKTSLRYPDLVYGRIMNALQKKLLVSKEPV